MNIIFFISTILLLVYVANVICCAIICEAQDELARIGYMVFLIPVFNVAIFFYFLLFIKDHEHTRFQYTIAFLKIPAKNYLVVEVLIQALEEYNRKVIIKPPSLRLSRPEFLNFANLYKKQVIYVKSMR